MVGLYARKIYLEGGMTGFVPSPCRMQRSISTVSIFGGVTGRWLGMLHKVKHFLEGRDHVGAAVVDGKMYVLD